MAQSKKQKQLMNFVYGMGAAIVIIGALFKIQHISLDLGVFQLSGGVMLTIGLVVEAFVFAISAFERVEEDLDWTKVYPELGADGVKSGKELGAQGLLSQKLDGLLKDAKIDGDLMTSLGESIRGFEGAAKNMVPTTDSLNATKKYSEEMSLAAAQMESLNSLYKVQLESVNRQASINEEVTDNAGKLKDQMASLATNLSSLNGVYGGMLSAMNKN